MFPLSTTTTYYNRIPRCKFVKPRSKTRNFSYSSLFIQNAKQRLVEAVVASNIVVLRHLCRHGGQSLPRTLVIIRY